MATYIGKRIVPVHCGKWDQTKTYEMLSSCLRRPAATYCTAGSTGWNGDHGHELLDAAQPLFPAD
jgi:hypothetical protein